MANLNSGSLRILCLHDDESNAMELSDTLEILGERLFEKYGIDLVYVNAPLISSSSSSRNHHQDHQQQQQQINNDKELPNRVWWEEEDYDKQEEEGGGGEEEEQQSSSSSSKKFVGLDASLLLLKQVWSSMPFWGILAIGKGAAVGSFLPLLAITPQPSFCIFVNGQSLLGDEQDKLIDNLSCLHIITRRTTTTGKEEKEAVEEENDSQRLLIKQFGGQVHQQETEKITKSTLNVIGKVRRVYISPCFFYSYFSLLTCPFLFFLNFTWGVSLLFRKRKGYERMLLIVVYYHYRINCIWQNRRLLLSLQRGLQKIHQRHLWLSYHPRMSVGGVVGNGEDRMRKVAVHPVHQNSC